MGQAVRINQGDIYWVQLPRPEGQQPTIPHPYVVIEESSTNDSGRRLFMACALTSNLKRGSWPGNVLLQAGEANLPRPSVVEVSKIAMLGHADLCMYIGAVSSDRMAQILAGIRFVQSFFR